MVHRAVLLPGAVLPASLAYPALLTALGPGVDAVAKELEVYAGDAPPPGYTLETEVAGILRAAQDHGWQRFHLVGYSGGGAAALAFAARHPGRVLSLGLLEPAWAGIWDDTSAQHLQLWREFARIEGLPADRFMAEFMRMNVRPDVVLAPAPWAADPPAWMAKRPAGIRALLAAFRSDRLDRAALAAFDRPVYFALGGLSNPDGYGEIAARLGRAFPDYTLEVYPQRHHFDPPHRAEPERLARSLTALWDRAEPPQPSPPTAPGPAG